MSLRTIHSVSDSNKHSSNVSALVSLGGNVLSGSDDGILKVWSSDLKLISETDLSVDGAILSLAADSDSVYTCTSDQQIHAFDKNTLKPLGLVQSTLNIPLKLYVEPVSNILYAGDSTGSVAKFERNKEIAKWELSEEVWDLLVTSDPLLIYTARDRDIAVTEIVTGNLRNSSVLRGTFEGRSPIIVSGDKLCCLNRDGFSVSIHENNLNSRFQLLKEIRIGENIQNALVLGGDGFVYSGGYDSKISQCDITTGNCTASVSVQSCVNALACASNGAYAALTDGRILNVG